MQSLASAARAIFQVVLCAGFVVVCAPLSVRAEPATATRAALKAQIHKAVDAEDWEAVKNLQAALAKLDASLGKPQSSPPAAEIKSATPARETVFDRLVVNGFRLQLAPNDDNPAQFAFSRDIHADAETVYTANFFLSWITPDSIADKIGWRQDAWDLNAEASVQAKLTSANNLDTDAWRYRGTLKGRYTWNPTAIDLDKVVSVLWNMSIKDEGSREFDYNRVSGEFNLTPTVPALAIGMFKPGKAGKDLSPVQFRWRPFFGIDAGTVTSARMGAADGADDVLWFTGRATAKLKLNFLAQWLKCNEVSLFADENLIFLSEVATWHSYLKAGANFMFNEHVGFSLNYSTGEDTPKFADEEIFSGAFTVKF
ncbi:MAG: hypothetical protein QOI04_153 [Verrucomicrobiota bacterium]|jgi:hypothetical protein